MNCPVCNSDNIEKINDIEFKCLNCGRELIKFQEYLMSRETSDALRTLT